MVDVSNTHFLFTGTAPHSFLKNLANGTQPTATGGGATGRETDKKERIPAGRR